MNDFFERVPKWGWVVIAAILVLIIWQYFG
jgi:hypothetical protein